MKDNLLSSPEKIDIIYDILRAQERRRKIQMYLTWTLRSLLLGALIYLATHPEVLEGLKTKILQEYIYPEVSRITSDIIAEQQNSLKEK